MRMVINFGQLLNYYRQAQNSQSFLELFESEELTLEEVLDREEELLMELRNNNSTLLKFFTPERIQTLITYITQFPSEESSEKAAQKYPYVASEVFATECSGLLDNVFTRDSLLKELFEFVDTEEVKDLTLAGYFNKAVTALLNKNSYELLSYIYLNSSAALKMSHHLYSKSIADVLLKILSNEDQGSPPFLVYLSEILDDVLGRISSESTSEACLNSSWLLVELLSLSSDIPTAQEIKAYFLSEKTLEILSEKLNTNHETVQKASLSILKALLVSEENFTEADEQDSSEESFQKFLEKYLTSLPEKLEQTPKDSNLKTSYKAVITVLGEARLRHLEILSILLKLPYKELHSKVVELGILDKATVSYT